MITPPKQDSCDRIVKFPGRVAGDGSGGPRAYWHCTEATKRAGVASVADASHEPSSDRNPIGVTEAVADELQLAPAALVVRHEGPFDAVKLPGDE